jgi:hypothetical protein
MSEGKFKIEPAKYWCRSCGWERPLGKKYESRHAANEAHRSWSIIMEMGCSLDPEKVEEVKQESADRKRPS